MRTLRSFPPATRSRRVLLGTVVGLCCVVYVVSFLLDEPIRHRLETQLNGNPDGYAATIRSVRFHPFGFSITLEDTQIVQDRHPKPPVADFPRLDASVSADTIEAPRTTARETRMISDAHASSTLHRE